MTDSLNCPERVMPEPTRLKIDARVLFGILKRDYPGIDLKDFNSGRPFGRIVEPEDDAGKGAPSHMLILEAITDEPDLLQHFPQSKKLMFSPWNCERDGLVAMNGVEGSDVRVFIEFRRYDGSAEVYIKPGISVRGMAQNVGAKVVEQITAKKD